MQIKEKGENIATRLIDLYNLESFARYLVEKKMLKIAEDIDFIGIFAT